MYILTTRELSDLSGKKARLWNFSPSHDRLAFRLDNSDDESVKYLIFLGCEKMSISTFWNIQSPKIEKGKSASYQLTDGDINIQFEEGRIMDDYRLY